MDIDDLPLSADDKQQVDDALTKLDIYVLEQKQLVSYQWLANELSIDALIARHALAAFIEQHRDELDVLWLLSGRTTAVNKYELHSQQQTGPSDNSSSSGGSNSSSHVHIEEDDTGDVVKVHEITLVRDADLQAVKQQFETVQSLHPYSIAAKPAAESQPIKDITAALYTLQMQQLLAMYDQPGDADNALRDGRYGAIEPDPSIKRNHTASLAPNGIIDQPINSHARHNQQSSASALTSTAAAPSSSATAVSSTSATAGGEMAGLKRAASKGNALANMFSRQTAALKQTPLPPAARASEAVEDKRAMQSNAATVLPAEEQKGDETGKRSKVKVNEDEDAAADMEIEEAEAAEEEKSAGRVAASKHKPSSASRKSKAKKAKSSTSAKKKRKRHTADEDDEFVYPNPYDSHSDEEKEVAEAEEEEEERYRATAAAEEAAGDEQQQVADSVLHDDERDDERMDGTEAGSRFKQFFTAQPASQSTSAMLPRQLRKVQKTFVDSEGYMRVEEVEEDDIEAEQQRGDREREEEKAREDKEGRRKEQRDKERREKEKAEEEQRERKEKERKQKRDQKKQDKQRQQEAEKEEETASPAGRRAKQKAASSDGEVMEDEGKEKEKEKGGKGGTKGKKGKEEASDSRKEKEAAAGKADSEKGGVKKEKGGKAAADSKPKNNASILSFFNRK